MHLTAVRGSVTSDTLTLMSIHIRFSWNESLYRWAATSRNFEGLFCLHLPDQTVQEAILLDDLTPNLTALRSSEKSKIARLDTRRHVP